MVRTKTVHRKCPICRMRMQDRHRPFCVYCRRLMEKAQTELDEWFEPALELGR